MKMLALMKYGDKAASTRQRLLQYQAHLSRVGIEIHIHSLLTNHYLTKTFAGENPFVLSVIHRYVSRLVQLLNAAEFDLI